MLDDTWGKALLSVKRRKITEEKENLDQIMRQVTKFKAEQERRLEFNEYWGDALINVKQKKMQAVMENLRQLERMVRKIAKEQERRLLL